MLLPPNLKRYELTELFFSKSRNGAMLARTSLERQNSSINGNGVKTTSKSKCQKYETRIEDFSPDS